MMSVLATAPAEAPSTAGPAAWASSSAFAANVWTCSRDRCSVERMLSMACCASGGTREKEMSPTD